MLGVSTGSKGKGFFWRRACAWAETGRDEGGAMMIGYKLPYRVMAVGTSWTRDTRTDLKSHGRICGCAKSKHGSLLASVYFPTLRANCPDCRIEELPPSLRAKVPRVPQIT